VNVRIGINPITWSNDDLPELGGDIPLERCLAEARAAGYAGVELGGKFPRTAAELRPRLAAHGLQLVSGWYSSRLLERGVAAEKAAIREHLTLLSEMGCSVLIYAEVSGAVHGERGRSLRERPVLEAERWPAFGAALTEMAEYLRGHGLRLAYHHHMGTVVESEAEIDRLMANTGEAVGLLLDTGHLTYAGGDPLRVVERHGPRIAHVHMKDVRPAVLDASRRADRSFLDAVVAGVFTVPGDGGIAYGPIVGRLKALGYDGWWVVEAEQDPQVAHPLTYARLGHENLSAWTKDAG
jgi:inosose dehydratase